MKWLNNEIKREFVWPIIHKKVNKKTKDNISPWIPNYDQKPNPYIHKPQKPYWYTTPLKSNIGYLYFFKRHSNIFIVITNYFKNHIYTVTSGNAHLGKKKKEKIAVHNIIKLIRKVLYILRLNKINCITISTSQRFSRHFYTINGMIRKRRIYVKGYNYILCKAHGFMKKRKKRRV